MVVQSAFDRAFTPSQAGEASSAATMAIALKQAGNVAFAQGNWCSRPGAQDSDVLAKSILSLWKVAQEILLEHCKRTWKQLPINRRIKQKQLSYTVTYQQLSLSWANIPRL